MYASPGSSPSTTQHSLPGGRYPLPGPDFHRLDRANFLAHRILNLPQEGQRDRYDDDQGVLRQDAQHDHGTMLAPEADQRRMD